LPPAEREVYVAVSLRETFRRGPDRGLQSVTRIRRTKTKEIDARRNHADGRRYG
jgi:hypothetical protein